MLSFIAIGLIAVVCYVVDSYEVFRLKGDKTSDGIPGFSSDLIWSLEAPDGFLSDLTAGSYKFMFQILPHYVWTFKFVEPLPEGQTDGIKFVLDLNKQAGCKLQYGDQVFFVLWRNHFFSPVMRINTTMKYFPITTSKSERNISVGIVGDLDCPESDTFALIRAGSYLGDGAEVPYDAPIACRGGADDYLEGNGATGFGVGRLICEVGRDVITGDKWPEEIMETQVVRGFNVIVCRLHSNICVLYKRSKDVDSKFELQNMELQNMEVEKNKLREHNRRLQISKGNGGLDSSDKNNESSSPNRGRGSSPNRGRGSSPNRGRGSSPNRGRGSSPNRGRGSSPDLASLAIE